jgi:hypothetical protein
VKPMRLLSATAAVVGCGLVLGVIAHAQEAKKKYGSTYPKGISTRVEKIGGTDKPPNLNAIYVSGEFGRHYLGAQGQGFLIANDFGHNHVAAKLKYAGQTEKLWVYDIEGLGGPQHAYEKKADEGQFGVWYRPNPGEAFFFWFYARLEENVLDPPAAK